MNAFWLQCYLWLRIFCYKDNFLWQPAQSSHPRVTALYLILSNSVRVTISLPTVLHLHAVQCLYVTMCCLVLAPLILHQRSTILFITVIDTVKYLRIWYYVMTPAYCEVTLWDAAYCISTYCVLDITYGNSLYCTHGLACMTCLIAHCVFIAGRSY